MKVLLIDDEEGPLDVFARFVEQMGLIPVPVLATDQVSLSNVISVITQEKCARVITDFHMGGEFNGLDILDAALNLGLQPECLVLCTTDVGNESVVEQVKSLGCFFLAKPVKFSAIERIMRNPFHVSEQS